MTPYGVQPHHNLHDWSNECTDMNCVKVFKAEDVGQALTDRDRARRTLLRAGFQDLGGEEWKPPIGPGVSAAAGHVGELTREFMKLGQACVAAQ